MTGLTAHTDQWQADQWLLHLAVGTELLKALGSEPELQRGIVVGVQADDRVWR